MRLQCLKDYKNKDKIEAINTVKEPIMFTRIRPLKKNYRYRLVIHNWDYYILDTERHLLSIFFPFLFWFTKQPMYQIDRKTMESMRVVTLTKDNYSQFRWNHLFTVLLLPLLRPIFERHVNGIVGHFFV